MSGNVGFTYIYTYHENGKLESYCYMNPQYQIPINENYYYSSGKIKLEMSTAPNTEPSVKYTYYYESGYIKHFFNNMGVIATIGSPTAELKTFDDGVASYYLGMASGTPSSTETCTVEQAREKLLAEAKGN